MGAAVAAIRAALCVANVHHRQERASASTPVRLRLALPEQGLFRAAAGALLVGEIVSAQQAIPLRGNDPVALASPLLQSRSVDDRHDTTAVPNVPRGLHL